MKFAQITKDKVLMLNFVPTKDVKNGITLQFRKALSDVYLPFAYCDIKKGVQVYNLKGNPVLKDIRNLKFVFILENKITFCKL